MNSLSRLPSAVRILSLLVCASTLLACRQSGTVVTPVRFDRPGAIAFACFDSATGLFVERGLCEGLEEVSTETVGLTALVAQTARGEVAAVDLRTGQVLDSDVVVPGFTFRRVGIDPVAIVVPPMAPATTYVASRGSRTIEWMPTADFRPDAIGPATSSGVVVLPRGAPSDLVLSLDGTTLVAPLPDESALATIRIMADGSLGAPVIVDLSSALPAAIVADAPAARFERYCSSGTPPRAPAAIAPRSTDEFAGLAAAPTRAILDELSGAIWISDAQLPLVHRVMVDVSGVTELPGLNVGAPIADLALTPVVPASLGATPESAPSRYLYGLDAAAGNVLAMDALDTSPSFGAVLPVNAGLDTPDRIHFAARARALSVMDARFDGSVCTSGSDEEATAGPNTLRGVFLAVGLADGSARIVDVFDLDADCRGGTECSSPLNVLDINVFVRRHQPRIGALLSDPISLGSTPTFSFETIPGLLEDSGRESSHTGPGLTPLACPAHMSPAWPAAAQTGASEPIVCASTDPWELPAERWFASWEGALPGTFRPGRLIATVDGAEGPWLSIPGGGICERGVIGASESSALEAEDPISAYGGDEVVITADLPSATVTLDECAAFLTPTDGSTRAAVGFLILSASDHRLRLGDALGDYSFEQVAGCFPDLTTYQVRTHQAYTVSGSLSGFVHRLTADVDGRCAPDPSIAVDPADVRSYRPSRAFVDTLFDNGWVAFQVQHDDATPILVPGARAVLTVSLSQIPPGLGASMRSLETVGSTGAIVDELVWSSTDRSLFGVDGHGDRLVQLRTDPFRVVRALR